MPRSCNLSIVYFLIYPLSYSISLLFLCIRGDRFLRKATLELVYGGCAGSTAPLKASLGRQHLVKVALALLTSLNVQEVEECLHRVPAYEGYIELGFGDGRGIKRTDALLGLSLLGALERALTLLSLSNGCLSSTIGVVVGWHHRQLSPSN